MLLGACWSSKAGEPTPMAEGILGACPGTIIDLTTSSVASSLVGRQVRRLELLVVEAGLRCLFS